MGFLHLFFDTSKTFTYSNIAACFNLRSELMAMYSMLDLSVERLAALMESTKVYFDLCEVGRQKAHHYTA
jgi:hypothetical protein